MEIQDLSRPKYFTFQVKIANIEQITSLRLPAYQSFQDRGSQGYLFGEENFQYIQIQRPNILVSIEIQIDKDIAIFNRSESKLGEMAVYQVESGKLKGLQIILQYFEPPQTCQNPILGAYCYRISRIQYPFVAKDWNSAEIRFGALGYGANRGKYVSARTYQRNKSITQVDDTTVLFKFTGPEKYQTLIKFRSSIRRSDLLEPLYKILGSRGGCISRYDDQGLTCQINLMPSYRYLLNIQPDRLEEYEVKINAFDRTYTLEYGYTTDNWGSGAVGVNRYFVFQSKTGTELAIFKISNPDCFGSEYKNFQVELENVSFNSFPPNYILKQLDRKPRDWKENYDWKSELESTFTSVSSQNKKATNILLGE